MNPHYQFHALLATLDGAEFVEEVRASFSRQILSGRFVCAFDIWWGWDRIVAAVYDRPGDEQPGGAE